MKLYIFTEEALRNGINRYLEINGCVVDNAVILREALIEQAEKSGHIIEREEGLDLLLLVRRLFPKHRNVAPLGSLSKLDYEEVLKGRT